MSNNNNNNNNGGSNPGSDRKKAGPLKSSSSSKAFVKAAMAKYGKIQVMRKKSLCQLSLGEYSKSYSCIRFYSYIRPLFVPESNNEARLVISIFWPNRRIRILLTQFGFGLVKRIVI